MTNFLQRTITGIALIIVVLTLINVGMYGFAALIFFVNFGGMLEFYRLAPITKGGMLTGLLLGATMLLTLGSILTGIAGWQILLIHVPVLFVVYLAELYSNNSKPFENLAYTFMGTLYVTLPLCFFTAIAFLPYGGGYHPTIVSGCFFMLWADDTGAYLFGKYLGRHPLFERISPHKTWEGSLGGAFIAVLTAVIIARCFIILSMETWLALSLIIVITGTYGDFFKSMLKRSLHVKDTGSILPGHGGVLDRFDSLLGSAPFVFSYLVLYGRFEI